jgi:hypothetical protein
VYNFIAFENKMQHVDLVSAVKFFALKIRLRCSKESEKAWLFDRGFQAYEYYGAKGFVPG